MLNIIGKFRDALTESVENVRRAKTEGVNTISGPEGVWALRNGQKVRDANGLDGVFRSLPSGVKTMQFRNYGPGTPIKDVSYPVTFKR